MARCHAPEVCVRVSKVELTFGGSLASELLKHMDEVDAAKGVYNIATYRTIFLTYNFKLCKKAIHSNDVRAATFCFEFLK